MSPRSTDTDTRPLWGRLRFGGRRASAMALAVPLGLLPSAAGGTALALAGLEPPTSLALAAVLAFAMIAFCIRYAVERRRG